MESYRIAVSRVDLDGIPVEVGYADVFVVVREGADAPGPTDWEAQFHTESPMRIAPRRHELAFTVPDGTHLRGAAIVRFSDGRRHLFRGDADLEGFERSVPHTEPPA